MARFDEGHRYDDTGLRYDSADPGSPQPTHKRMAQVKIDLREKPNTVIIDQAKAYHSALTGNAAFPTPNPTLVNFRAAIDLAEASLNARLAGEAEQRNRVVKENTDVEALYGEIVTLAAYVQNASGGDEGLIISAGFGVRAGATPSQPLPAPVDFLATMSDHSGAMDLVWSPVKGARGYIVECRVHNDAGQWQQVKFCTASKTEATGLTPGVTYAFRVKAVGPIGDSPWSAETARMAP